MRDSSLSHGAQTDRWNPASGRFPPQVRVVLFLRFFLSLPARACSALIWLYQKTLSPALVVIAPACGCRFAPTCSHYARESLAQHGLLVGLALTARRLVKCGPWHPGGLDPVPQRSRPLCTAVHRGI